MYAFRTTSSTASVRNEPSQVTVARDHRRRKREPGGSAAGGGSGVASLRDGETSTLALLGDICLLGRPAQHRQQVRLLHPAWCRLCMGVGTSVQRQGSNPATGGRFVQIVPSQLSALCGMVPYLGCPRAT